jgi:hypothetical protein
MTDDPVRKRTRRAAKRIERQRRKALATPTRKAAEVPRSAAQTPREPWPWSPRPAAASSDVAR